MKDENPSLNSRQQNLFFPSAKGLSETNKEILSFSFPSTTRLNEMHNCMCKNEFGIFVLRIQKFSQMRPKISFRMKSEPTKTTINMLQQIPNFLDLESDSALDFLSNEK